MTTKDPDLATILKGRSLVIASNRGPVAFERSPSGDLIPDRGAGGLVTALTHVMKRVSGVWVASAMTAGDRELVRRNGSESFEVPFDEDTLRLRYLVFDRDLFDRYYNRVSNWVFWFLLHGMWDLTLQPRFDMKSKDAWEAYHTVNERFAEALAEEIKGTSSSSPIMLHDYHLLLVGGYLRKLVPDAFTYHFMHCPWPQSDGMQIAPSGTAKEVLTALLSNDLLGFQTARWANNFLQCCRDLLEAKVDFDEGLVIYRDRESVVRHYPISIDVDAVRQLAYSQQGDDWVSWLQRLTEGRKIILRIDRMELSKNIVRGLLAYEEFLRAYPQWQGKVVHVALLYPSRRALAEYRAYEAQVLATYDRINADLGTDDWQPIIMFNEDNYLRALACSRIYDVLLVNPIADGMNLVAKEGPSVNENNGVLVLSKNAGAWAELGHGALGVNPFDLADMAQALQTALTMESDSRSSRAAFLKDVIQRNTPAKWIWHQLVDIRRLHES